MTTSFFVMELEHGKYFVGASQDPVKTLEEHREGLTRITWTQIHRPIRLLSIVPVAVKEQLDDYVCQWMREEGMENVRGGSWSDVRLRDKDRRDIGGRAEAGKRKAGCVVA
jgi:predicted GIY-YIG superfamily endonuclease